MHLFYHESEEGGVELKLYRVRKETRKNIYSVLEANMLSKMLTKNTLQYEGSEILTLVVVLTGNTRLETYIMHEENSRRMTTSHNTIT